VDAGFLYQLPSADIFTIRVQWCIVKTVEDCWLTLIFSNFCGGI